MAQKLCNQRVSSGQIHEVVVCDIDGRWYICKLLSSEKVVCGKCAAVVMPIKLRTKCKVCKSVISRIVRTHITVEEIRETPKKKK